MKSLFLVICLASFSYGELARKLKLSSDYEMPVIGFGTNEIKEDEMEKVIGYALENDYRLFDTDFSLASDAAFGKALKKWFDAGGKREELFIISKLPPYGNKPEFVEKYLKRSLESLGLEYVDLYLIKAPWAEEEGENYAPKESDGKRILLKDIDHIALWKEMEKQVKEKRVRSIGLSNFNETQIQKIYEIAEIKPSVLEVESHAYLQQKKLREFCKKYNIIMTAYAPLGSMEMNKDFYSNKGVPYLTENPKIKELAEKYNKTPAQILLRYSIQDGLVVIPQSVDPARQKENMKLFDFELTPEDFTKIGTLDMGEKGRIFQYLNFYIDLDKNPQYPFQKFEN